MPDDPNTIRQLTNEAQQDLGAPVPYSMIARRADGNESALGGFPTDGWRPESKKIPYAIAGVSTTFPFKGIKLGNGDIRIVYGTVNGVEPDGMIPGDNPPYTFTPSGTGYAWLKITTDATTFEITDREIGNGASIPANTSTTWYNQILSYTVSGPDIAIAQAIISSQWFQLCGGSNPIWNSD